MRGVWDGYSTVASREMAKTAKKRPYWRRQADVHAASSYALAPIRGSLSESVVEPSFGVAVT